LPVEGWKGETEVSLLQNYVYGQADQDVLTDYPEQAVVDWQSH
jgi:hypothetical protein